MTDTRRDPSEPPLNGDVRYVTHAEHQDDLLRVTNRYLVGHAELRRGHEVLVQNDGAIMAELGRINEDMAKLSRGERVLKRKMKSMPEVVAKAIDDAEETTGITRLRKRERLYKRLFWGILPPTVAGVVIVLILHYAFHLG